MRNLKNFFVKQSSAPYFSWPEKHLTFNGKWRMIASESRFRGTEIRYRTLSSDWTYTTIAGGYGDRSFDIGKINDLSDDTYKVNIHMDLRRQTYIDPPGSYLVYKINVFGKNFDMTITYDNCYKNEDENKKISIKSTHISNEKLIYPYTYNDICYQCTRCDNRIKLISDAGNTRADNSVENLLLYIYKVVWIIKSKIDYRISFDNIRLM
jgi:hypothetical protein